MVILKEHRLLYWKQEHAAFQLLPLTMQAYLTLLLMVNWVALLITVLTINFVGDGLRDAFDPKQGK